MKLQHHPSLTVERWKSFSWDKRLLNIAAELIRAKNAIQKHDEKGRAGALERALELTDLTVEAGREGKTPGFLAEFLRFRELLASYYICEQKSEEEIIRLTEAFFDLDATVHNLHLQI